MGSHHYVTSYQFGEGSSGFSHRLKPTPSPSAGEVPKPPALPTELTSTICCPPAHIHPCSMTSEQLPVFWRNFHLPLLPGIFLLATWAEEWVDFCRSLLSPRPFWWHFAGEGRSWMETGEHKDADMSNVWTRVSEMWKRFSGVSQAPRPGFHEPLPSQTGHIAAYQ